MMTALAMLLLTALELFGEAERRVVSVDDVEGRCQRGEHDGKAHRHQFTVAQREAGWKVTSLSC